MVHHLLEINENWAKCSVNMQRWSKYWISLVFRLLDGLLQTYVADYREAKWISVTQPEPVSSPSPFIAIFRTKPKHNPVIYSELLSFKKTPQKSTSWSRCSSLLQKPSSAGVVGPAIHNAGQRWGVLFVCLFFLLFFFLLYTHAEIPHGFQNMWWKPRSIHSEKSKDFYPPSNICSFYSRTKCDDASDTIKPTNMTVRVKRFLTKE